MRWVSHHQQWNWESQELCYQKQWNKQKLSCWVSETFRWSCKERKLHIVVKWNALKRKLQEKQDGASTLEEAFQALQKKKKFM